MKYTLEQRLAIGREIYTNKITKYQAAQKYDINDSTARWYMRMYRDRNDLPPMSNGEEELKILNDSKKTKFEDLADMTKDELIDEVIKARIEAERAKKGYKVKGGGQEKEFVSLNKKNSK